MSSMLMADAKKGGMSAVSTRIIKKAPPPAVDIPPPPGKPEVALGPTDRALNAAMERLDAAPAPPEVPDVGESDDEDEPPPLS